MPEIISNHDRMFGVAGWCGTIDKEPALLLSFRDGSVLWVFRGGKWVKDRQFEHLAEANENLGIP